VQIFIKTFKQKIMFQKWTKTVGFNGKSKQRNKIVAPAA
jgi:hypothetical protein